MRNGFFLILVILFFQSKGQDTIQYGRLVDVSSRKGAENINVINMRTGRAAMTDMHGYFRLPCRQRDSVLISSVQYERKSFMANPSNDTVLFFVIPAVYVLPDVKIFKFRTYDQFKEAVLTLPEKELTKNEIPWFRQYFTESKSEYVAVKSFSPITYLYDRYSKHAKELKRYNYIIEQEKMYSLINSRYNPDIVSRITGVKDTSEIKKIMSQCSIPESFILKAKEYELNLAILECYRKYLKK